MLNIFFLTCLVKYSFGANILFVSLLPSPSHHIWNEALVGDLLTNGHNITKLALFPAKISNSNYTLLYVDAKPLVKNIDDFVDKTMMQSTLISILDFWRFTAQTCNYCFQSEVFKTILGYPKNFFNLIIFDVASSSCFYPFIDHFGKPPVVGVTALGMQPYINGIIGQRSENYVPFYSLPYTPQMGFFQRLNNVLHQNFEQLCKWYFMPAITDAAKQVFGKDTPNLNQYENSFSLIFSNDDPILDYPKTFPPNVIPVGGIHVRKPKKLNDDLQRILEKSTEGVIFVSMGSNFKTKHYTEEAKNGFIGAFSRLNQTIVWKFDGIDVPKNVILGKWFSQTDILAHPNTKLFITHCGELSSQEAVIRGVPVIGVPLFFDQHSNAQKFELLKTGIILNYSELTADGIYKAIIEILSNPTYKQNMLKLSNLYRSQPQQANEKFLLWTEYVLKHGHLGHLSVASRSMRWYQIDNWDIFAFSVIIIGVVWILFKKLLYFLVDISKESNEKQKVH